MKLVWIEVARSMYADMPWRDGMPVWNVVYTVARGHAHWPDVDTWHSETLGM